jgi:hypothetical protein
MRCASASAGIMAATSVFAAWATPHKHQACCSPTKTANYYLTQDKLPRKGMVSHYSYTKYPASFNLLKGHKAT